MAPGRVAVTPWSSGVGAAGTMSSKSTVTRDKAAAGISDVPRASSAQLRVAGSAELAGAIPSAVELAWARRHWLWGDSAPQYLQA